MWSFEQLFRLLHLYLLHRLVFAIVYGLQCLSFEVNAIQDFALYLGLGVGVHLDSIYLSLSTGFY